jgi:hypothetical protein
LNFIIGIGKEKYITADSMLELSDKLKQERYVFDCITIGSERINLCARYISGYPVMLDEKDPLIIGLADKPNFDEAWKEEKIEYMNWMPSEEIKSIPIIVHKLNEIIKEVNKLKQREKNT